MADADERARPPRSPGQRGGSGLTQHRWTVYTKYRSPSCCTCACSPRGTKGFPSCASERSTWISPAWGRTPWPPAGPALRLPLQDAPKCWYHLLAPPHRSKRGLCSENGSRPRRNAPSRKRGWKKQHPRIFCSEPPVSLPTSGWQTRPGLLVLAALPFLAPFWQPAGSGAPDLGNTPCHGERSPRGDPPCCCAGLLLGHPALWKMRPPAEAATAELTNPTREGFAPTLRRGRLQCGAGAALLCFLRANSPPAASGARPAPAAQLIPPDSLTVDII